jgi:hypothetical protein
MPKASGITGDRIPRISGLAIAAFILGITSFFTYGLTIIPAIILGIVSIVIIEKSGGKLTGRGFAIVGIIVSVLIFFEIFVSLFIKTRKTSFRLICGTYLSGIGKAMYHYANDYDNEFPRAGGLNSKWGHTPNWQADNLSDAFSLKDGDGQATISASLYLLVKYEDVKPKSFICKGESRIREFKSSKYGIRDKKLSDLWDFGPNPYRHCSYSYHLPYGKYSLTSSNLPGMAIAADRNPWIKSPVAKTKDFSKFDSNGTNEQIRYGNTRYDNTTAHMGDGQNVLFVDSHVSFEGRTFCGVNDDNIYTSWSGSDILRGTPPTFTSQPQSRVDSLLVNDPPDTR